MNAAVTDSASASEAMRILCRLLAGELPRLADDLDPRTPRSLLELGEAHGVLPLLYRTLRNQPALPPALSAIQRELAERAMAHAAHELAVARELRTTFQRLADAQIRLLLFKGTPLAYSLYPEPHLRPRGDTDLFVPEAQRHLAGRVLTEAGYGHELVAARDLTSCELSYSRTDRLGLKHTIDLHWRLSSRWLYAQALGFDELYEAGEPLPVICAAARMPSLVHSLLIACMHRISHLPYGDANRLIWLFDIHLMAQRLSADGWSQLAALAEDKHMRAICLDGLEATQRHLGSPVPEDILERLAAPGPPELSAQYLRPGRWRESLLQLRCLPNNRQRARMIAEWLFPSAEYMMRKYGTRSRWLLPFLYPWRAVNGVIRRPDSGEAPPRD